MGTASNLFWALVAAGLTFAAAFMAGQFTPETAALWYGELIKPDFQPNGAIFGVVWPVLYVLIAVSGWLVMRDSISSPADVFWVGQLIVNPVWTYAFFGLQQPSLALVTMWLLWFLIGGFYFSAWQHSRLATILFVPYWVWITYALCLNMEVVRLNA